MSSSENICVDAIVIGGGISGLYTTLRYSQLYPDKKVILLEASDRFGGIIETCYGDNGDVLYEKSAWRVQKNHVRFRALLSELGLKIHEMPHKLLRVDCKGESLDKTIYFNDESGMPNSFFIETGFSSFIDRLESILNSLPNVTMFTNVSVQDILTCNTDNTYKLVTNTIGGFISRQLFVCCPFFEFFKWPILSEISFILEEEIMTKNYIKIISMDQQRPLFDGIHDYYIVTDRAPSRIITSPTSSALYLSYADHYHATKWIRLWETDRESFYNLLSHEWDFFFPDTPLSAKNNLNIIIYTDIVHRLKCKHLLYRLKQPLPNMYIIHSAFSDFELHVEGSLQCAEDILKMLHPTVTFNIVLNPLNVDYQPMFDYIIDQSGLSSCTSNACANLIYFQMKRTGLLPFMPSSLYIYYNTRREMGTTHEDSGSFYPCVDRALRKYGICPETMWPIEKNNVLKSPSQNCYHFSINFGIDMSISKIHVENDYPSLFFNTISKILLGGHVILGSIRRNPFNDFSSDMRFVTKDKHVSHDEALVDKSASPYVSHYHSVLIVGIHFDTERIICLNSHGVEGGFNGFFYCSFQDVVTHDILLRDDCYMLHMHVKNSVIPNEVIGCITSLDVLPKLSISRLLSPLVPNFSTIPSTIEYDHVIIGGGITGSYLAYRLHQIYPTSSILIIDNHLGRSSVFDVYENDYDTFIPSCLYRVSLDVMPRSIDLLSKCSNVHNCTYENDMISENIKDIVILILSKLGVSLHDSHDLTELFSLSFRIECMKRHDLFHTTTEEFLTTLDKDHQKYLFQTCLRGHPLFYEGMNLFHFIFLVLLDIIKTQWIIPMDLNLTYSYLLKDFDIQNLDSFMIGIQKRRVVLKGVTALCDNYLENNIHIGLSNDSTKYSDTIKIRFKELYAATSKRTNISSPYISTTIKSRCSLYLFLNKNVLKHVNNGYDNTFGKIIILDSCIVQCIITNPFTYWHLLRTRPAYVKDGMRYDCQVFPSLQQMIHDRFGISTMMSFMIFFCDHSLYDISCGDRKKSLWDVLIENYGLGSNKHILNSNLSPFFYCLEGSLEIVDLFLENFTAVTLP